MGKKEGVLGEGIFARPFFLSFTHIATHYVFWYSNGYMNESSFQGDRRDTSSLDIWLATEFREEYDRQYRILNKLGLLDILPESNEMGIIGIDNQEYPIPSKETIEQEIKRNREVYETKLSQGFTEIQLTPFAIPLDNLISTLEQRIKEHHKQGKLLATKESPSDKDEPLDLDTNQPVYVWDEWKGSDIDGSGVYHPTSFDQTKHNGYTKAEVLKAKEGLPLAGWNVLMVEPNKNIPRQGKGKTIGKRKQIETNQTPREYLKQLQTNPEYANEQGMTNEDWLTMFITHLEKTNQVIDDYSGKGSANFLAGSYKPSSDFLGYGNWNRDNRQAFLYRGNPGNRVSSTGLRSAVGIGQELVFGV